MEMTHFPNMFFTKFLDCAAVLDLFLNPVPTKLSLRAASRETVSWKLRVDFHLE